MRTKENLEKQMAMQVENYEKVSEAKTQSGNLQAVEWSQQKDILESKVCFSFLFIL